MSQTASFLTEYLFPGLLIGCGCLGLGVVNALAQGAVEGPRSTPRGSKAPAKGQVSGPASARSAPARSAPVMRVRPSRSARVAPLRRVVRPTRHRVRFARRKIRVSDGERERLRIFLAAARLGAANRVTVVGHPKGRRGKRRARRRAAAVVKLLQALGVAAATIAAPQVTDEGGAGRAVTIVVGKR